MKKELNKALLNKFFICICLYGIVVAIIHSYDKITEYRRMMDELIQYNLSSKGAENPHASITNAFTLWIGNDPENKYTKIIYFIFPLISVLPYCWSYCSDLKNGQADKSVKEIGKLKYHFSKYVAVFISSGLIMVIPLLLNFLIILLFVPAIFPDSIYDIYYGICSRDFMADLFYGQPFLYILTFLFLCFIFCGLFGCLGYSVSTLIKSKIVAIAIPVMLVFSAEYIQQLLIKKGSSNDSIFSPLTFLFPAKSYTTDWFIIISEMIILFLLTFYISVIRFKKLDKQRCEYEK